MRKLKLLLAACTLLGASAAWAQTDVTSTYLTNADFSQGPVVTVDVRGYGKDMVSGDVYSVQDVTGWSYEILNPDNKTPEYPNSAMGGAVFAYGSSNQLKGNNVTAPGKGPDDASGNCLGFFAVWSSGAYYYQEVTLPAGKYTLTIPMYSQSGTQANESYTGFFPKNGTAFKVAVNPTVGSWVNQTVSFTLNEETEGQIRVGYKSTGLGSGANPHIFIDAVKLTWVDPNLAKGQSKLSGYIKKATALNSVLKDEGLGTAITTAQSVLETATTENECNNASDNLGNAISSLVSGLTTVTLANGNFDESVNISKDGTNNATFIEPATAEKPYIYPVSGWTPNFKFSSTAAQGTTAAYGANITGNCGNNGTNPPSTDMFGATDGGTLHLSSGWSDQARYYQKINLSTGRYMFYYEANNQNSGATNLVDNFFGASGEAGGFYGTSNSFVYSEAKNFPYNEWCANAFEFDVAKSGDITIHVGVTGSAGGSASAPKLWIDNVLVYRFADLMVSDEDANKIIADVEALADVVFNADVKTELNSALSTFKGNSSMDNYVALNSTLASAKESIKVYKSLETAVKNVESWSTQGAAVGIRSKFDNGEYDNNATAESIYEEYQTAEIAALANNDASDWTSAILNASFETGDMTCWSADKRDDTGVKENSNSTYSISNGVDGRYVFNTWGGTNENNIYQTVKSLPSGTYTLSALLAGFPGEALVLSANDKKDSVIVAGDKTTGYTVNVVFDHSGGDLTIKASNTKSQETSDKSFIKADNFQLFKGGLASDYTALNEAIESAEAKVLGFEDGQYAPYNNVEVLTALADAKAIDQEGKNSQSMIDGLVEFLNKGWTSNSGDVDIVFNGHFSIADGWNPKGWSRSNGAWGQQITGLDSSTGAEEGTAWYYNTEGAWEYGKAGIYTMPLPANTAYTLTFKYRSHAWNTNNWMKASVLNSNGEGLAETWFEKNPSHENFVTATVSFSTGEAGNYVLSLYQSGNTHLTDVSMVKASAVTAEVTTDGYATFVSDAQLDFSNTSIKAYTAKVEDDKVVLTSINKVPAKTPVVLYCEGGKTEEIPFASETDTPAASDLVAGNSGEIKTEDGDYTNYILNNAKGIGFYYANGMTVAREHAYLHVNGGSTARLQIVFDGDATAISEVKSIANGEAVYNLSGQRVNSPKKGLYIIGGKKVVLK